MSAIFLPASIYNNAPVKVHGVLAGLTKLFGIYAQFIIVKRNMIFNVREYCYRQHETVTQRDRYE